MNPIELQQLSQAIDALQKTVATLSNMGYSKEADLVVSKIRELVLRMR